MTKNLHDPTNSVFSIHTRNHRNINHGPIGDLNTNTNTNAINHGTGGMSHAGTNTTA